MPDPFDDFAAEMNRRTQQVRQEETQRPPRFTEQDQRDRAVISAMASIPLRKGQMLLLGPESVRLLSTPGAYAGVLPDKLILDKDQWGVVK